jgi:hypothetical protein
VSTDADKPRIVLVSAAEAKSIVPREPSRFDVRVQSTVPDPQPSLLVTLRALILADSELSDLFVRFRREQLALDWLRDMLAARVFAKLKKVTFEETLDACQYLADEYHQLGEGYFIVSTETGKVVLVVSEDDLYDPGLLARHSGDMGQALRRLNPHLETSFVLHRHEQEREQRIVSTLAERLHQTDLTREEGDQRLRIATRSGRTAIAQDLAGDDAWELLRRSSGTTGMFLRHFDLVEHQPGSPSLEGVATFRSTMSVQDALTSNLSYNRLGTLRGAAPQGWIRDVARHLCSMAHHSGGSAMHVDDLDAALLDTQELWIADPDVYTLMRKAKAAVVPVEGVTPIGFSGKVGSLVVPREFSVETRESGGRWEVSANLPYQLYVDFSKIELLALVGVERAATVDH